MKEIKFAGVCVVQDGKILMVQEGHKEAYELWSLPLGHVEAGETMEQAAIRETKEETGYDVVLGESIGMEITGAEFRSTAKFENCLINLRIYKGNVCGGRLLVGSDLLDAKWIKLSDLEKLPLRGIWIKNAIKF